MKDANPIKIELLDKNKKTEVHIVNKLTFWNKLMWWRRYVILLNDTIVWVKPPPPNHQLTVTYHVVAHGRSFIC